MVKVQLSLKNIGTVVARGVQKGHSIAKMPQIWICVCVCEHMLYDIYYIVHIISSWVFSRFCHIALF